MFEDGPVEGSDLDDLDFDDTDLDAAELDMAHDDADLGGDDDFDLGDMDEQPEGDFGSVAQTEDVISESDIYIAYGKFEQAVDLLTAAIDQEPSRSDLRLKLLEVYVEMDDADAFAQQEGQLNGIGDDEANQQAEQMRSRLSTPVSPLVGGQTDGLSLDQDIPSLDDSLGEEFSEGLDFGDALDLADGDGMPSDELGLDLGEESSSESLEFDLSGTDANDDIPSLDEEASLEDVPTLDLDETLEFDLSADSAELELNESDSSDDELGAFDDVEDDAEDDSLEFDLSGLENVGDDDVKSDTPDNAEEEATDDSLEFDLGSLAAGDDDSGLEDLLGESGDDEVIDISDDIADISGGAEAADSDSDLADLESLMDAEGSVGEPELPDLSFEMDEETGFSESADDDLKALEAELDSAAEPQAETVETDVDAAEADDELMDTVADAETDDRVGEAADEPAVDFAADLAELDAELDDFDAAPQDQEVPVVDDVAEQAAADGDKDIDLDKLAAAEDEFDFLAGTDECATKLDLARAYIDMEDMDGARELLQEVLQEGSDQQKQDARSLMDNMS
jgi:pilus assembly protein FimV